MTRLERILAHSRAGSVYDSLMAIALVAVMLFMVGSLS